MFLQELFASLLHRRSSIQPSLDEEGKTISRRLRELLDPKQADQVKVPPEESGRKERHAGTQPL